MVAMRSLSAAMTVPPAARMPSSSLWRRPASLGIASTNALACSAAANPAARGEILGAAPIAPLLPATRLQRGNVLDQQRAHPRRPAELVRRDRDEVGIGQRQLAGGLRAIGKQQRSRAPHGLSNAIERLDHAGLVIDMLDRDQRGTFGQIRCRARPDRSRHPHRPAAGPRFGAHRRDAPHHARSRHSSSSRHLRRGLAAIAIASLAPEVKMTSCRQPSASRDRLASPAPAQPARRVRRHGASWGWPSGQARRPSPLAPRAAPAWSRHGRDRCRIWVIEICADFLPIAS